MKLIINAEPEDVLAVAALMLEQRHMFDGEERLGWGWFWPIPGGRRFFIRQIKGGLSASPAKERP